MSDRRKADRRIPPAVAQHAIEERAELLARIEEQAREIERLECIVDKAWNRSHSIEHGVCIPGALDAWKRPVLQFLPYDFSGNPGASATQYCNGWNDAGGYWKAHADDLSSELAALKAKPRGVLLPEPFELRPFQTVDQGSTNYKAGFNAALRKVRERLNPCRAQSVPDGLLISSEGVEHLKHARRELTRMDRAPLYIRQALAQKISNMLAAPAPGKQEGE